MRNRLWVKICTWAALVSFAGLIIASVFISTAGAEKTSKEIQEEIEGVKEQQSANAAEREQLDAEINDVYLKIHDLELQIADTSQKIEQKELELTDAQEKSDQQNKAYQKRVKIMVEKGPVSYLEVLFNSKSFSDLLTRVEVIQAVADYDSTLLDRLKAVETEIETLKAELEQEKENQQSLLSDNEAQKQILQEKIDRNDQLMRELEADLEAYEEEYQKAKAAEEAAWRAANNLTSQNTVYTGGQLLWPAATTNITSYFGPRNRPTAGASSSHAGLDIGSPRGSNVVAAESGRVIVASWNSGYGNYIMIDHGGGLVTLYAHNDALLVSVGQSVERGQVIAKCGSTGVSTGPHVHFEVRVNGTAVNPLSYVQ